MRRFAIPLLLIAVTAVLAVLAALGTALLAFPETAAAQGARTALPPDAWTWGLMSAAIATGLSSLAGGYAVARLGTAAVGALAEKPDLFGRLLIFVGLAEGIAIYGVIISILILNRLT
jgi:V/A-type H+-transporting ATPase subunit K